MIIVKILGGLGNQLFQYAAAKALAEKNNSTGIMLTVPECNSLGLAMLGGHKLESAFEAIQNNYADSVIILETDLYRSADKTLVDNLLAKARQTRSRTAVLVAGGFHTPALEKLLLERGQSVATVTPSMTDLEKEGNSLDVFLPNRTPLEKLLLGEKLMLSLPGCHHREIHIRWILNQILVFANSQVVAENLCRSIACGGADDRRNDRYKKRQAAYKVNHSCENSCGASELCKMEG